MVRVGDLIAIMEECVFDEDDSIDTDSLEFEVNTVHIVLQFIKVVTIIYAIMVCLAAITFSICF